MSAFSCFNQHRECLQLGAQLPLYTTESLSGWLYRRIRVVIDGFEISYISLIYGLPQNPPQQSLGYADDLIFGMCDIRICLTKIPKSWCVFLPLQHWIAAKTFHRGYTQSLSLWLTQQRHKCRRTTRPTYLPDQRWRDIYGCPIAQSRASFAQANCPRHASDEPSGSENQTCSICLMDSPVYLTV